MRFEAENEQLRKQVALLKEQIRIKDGTTSPHTTLEGKTPRERPRCPSESALTTSSEMRRIGVGRIKTLYAIVTGDDVCEAVRRSVE